MTKKYAYIRAVKNRLCRIEDEINVLYTKNKMPENCKRELIGISCDIDKCVESLEKCLKIIK